MSCLLSPTFIIGKIKIGSVEGASAVNFGNNWPTDFTNYTKHNQGFGNVDGDHNKLDGLKSLLNDADGLELFNHADGDIPEWLQQKIAEAVSEQEEEEEEEELK